MPQQSNELFQGFGLFCVLGRQLFDVVCQIFEMLVAFDGVDELRACKGAKEKSRLVFIFAGKRLRAWVLSRLALPREFLEELDLSLESAAHFGERWQRIFRVSLRINRVLKTREGRRKTWCRVPEHILPNLRTLHKQ